LYTLLPDMESVVKEYWSYVLPDTSLSAMSKLVNSVFYFVNDIHIPVVVYASLISMTFQV